MKTAAALQNILDLPRDLQGAAFEAVATGKPIHNLRAYATAVLARENTPCGSVSLDGETEDVVRLHERVAATEVDEIERWRTVTLDDATELMLSMLADSAGALAGFCAVTGKRSVTKRRAQQIVKQLIEKAGQGDLFSQKHGDDNDEAEVSTTSTPQEPKPSPDAVELEEEVAHE